MRYTYNRLAMLTEENISKVLSKYVMQWIVLKVFNEDSSQLIFHTKSEVKFCLPGWIVATFGLMMVLSGGSHVALDWLQMLFSYRYSFSDYFQIVSYKSVHLLRRYFANDTENEHIHTKLT